MQETSALWKQLFAAGADKEVKVVVTGNPDEEYLQNDRLVSLRTSHALMSKPLAVGNCVAQEVDLVLRNVGTIPRAGEFKVYVRLNDGTQQSEWIPKGVFYVDTRDLDEETGELTIHGFDAMLKTEQIMVPEGTTGLWPRTDANVVSEICTRIGVTLDNRTALGYSYNIDFPNDYSMREVLGYIGSAYGGNWCITDAGKLRLVPLYNRSASSLNLGEKVGRMETSSALSPISKVTLWYGEENAYIAGTDSGYAIEADCPWATQTVANNLLSAVLNYVYYPFSVTDALIDPAVEPGDNVVIDGDTYPMWSIDATFDVLWTADIEAPHNEELDHEYPYLGGDKLKSDRVVKLNTSYYGAKITRQEGLVIEKTNGGSVQLNSDEFIFYDRYGNPAIYLDSSSGKYKFVGDMSIVNGSINIQDTFIVDSNGNVTMSGRSNIYGGNYYAGTETSPDGYTVMTADGLRVYNGSNLLKILLGYTTNGEDYPFLQLGAGSGSSESKGLIKKFLDGLWIGNSAPKESSGIFSAQPGYIGIFFCFTDNKAYIVSGTNMANIYTGESIARFG